MANLINLDELKDTIQDSNVNFLFGSGLSTPYIKTLRNIEELLTTLADSKMKEKYKKIIEASLYKKYFDDVVVKNVGILDKEKDAQDVLSDYKNLLKVINSILLERKSTILTKQANIFTTNIDVFLEKAIDELGLECNDGFSGRFSRSFSLSNFKKSCFMKSLHYDNTSEIPVLNILKMHGSVAWQKKVDAEKINFSASLRQIKSIADIKLSSKDVITVDENSTLKSLLTDAKKVSAFKNKPNDVPRGEVSF